MSDEKVNRRMMYFYKLFTEFLSEGYCYSLLLSYCYLQEKMK